MTRRMIILVIVCVAIFLGAVALVNAWNDLARLLPWTSQHRAARAEAQLVPAVASAKALDEVATATPAIRADQKEKEDEVDKIDGADARLPDGFGAELERVRRGQRDNHP